MAAASGAHRWVALLRGINVGGHRLVKMPALRAVFESLGATDVHTVVQSGNVVFDHATPEREGTALRHVLQAGLAKALGFEVPVLLRSAAQFRKAAAAHPFAKEAAEPTHAHVYFLDEAPPHPDRAALDQLASPTERWHLHGDAFYLHAPDGVGRSKLAAGAEKKLGVPATARNQRTVESLLALL